MWLAHHGVKGMKWGVRRYQNYDGSLIKNGDMIISKDSNFYRFSNKKEKGSLKGAYVSQRPSDVNEYYVDAKHARIGFKDYDKILMTKISLLDDAKVRRGQEMVKDIVNELNDKKVSDAYEYLNNIGFLDDSKSAVERGKIWQSTKKAKLFRNTLATAVNKYTYKKDTASKDFLDKYSNMGYDAIVDPEDFVWNYERPMILINDKKFKRDNQIVVYDKSYSDFLKKRDKETKKDTNEYYEYNDDKLKDKIKEL